MILFSKKYLLILLLPVLSMPLVAQEVDLFSEKNTAEFASYLFQSGQYTYAAEEYARLGFLFPANKEYQVGLLKSYRFANDFTRGINAYQGFVSPNIDVKNEYAKLNILDNNKLNLSTLITELDQGSNFRNNLDLTLRLISYSDDVPALNGLETDKIDPGLLNLYYEASKLKHKSPFLAASMSTFLPGMGKVYSGRWKDGLMSLIFVGTTAYQAYRGFEKKGVQSAYGWIMGGVSLGFYLGNIYGSAKAAKLYNTNQHSIYVDKVSHYYIDHL